MIWSFIFIQGIFVCDTVFAAEENRDSRSANFITRKNKQLVGHVVKQFESPSFMSCSQSCLRNSWCTSTNFRESSKEEKKGTCELNKNEIAPINEDTHLIDKPCVTFSMFLKGCLMTGCLNRGSCLFDKKKETFTCSCELPWSGNECEVKTAKSCQELKTSGENLDGIYDINPDGHGTISVFCDQTTDGGGWTVVQRRISPYNASFDQLWIGYRNGFGDLSGEFWLGNDNLHRIAASAGVLRVDLTADSGQKGYATYGGFTVGDAVGKFRWDMNTYNGNIGNGIYGRSHSAHNIRGMKFSTKDEDNDNNPNGRCVKNGGWWVNWCGLVNLNLRNGPVWKKWATIVFTEMKIRKN